ncbi:MAG TPA: Uma2 family endonuclease [Gemmataceae bacterium]|nr:Uma2 family endonuclease [Gemmataceae bacterium]
MPLAAEILEGDEMSSLLLEQVVAGRAPAVFPLTVDQYHRMIESGILKEGEPTELIDGILVRKDRSDRGGTPMAHGPRHALTVKRADRLLRSVDAFGWHLHVQLPVTLSALQEPEPDLAVVKGRPEDYLERHPGPKEIGLLVEVSDSSLEYDRTTKQRLYAAVGIVLYWIINLVEHQVEVYEQPLAAEGRYALRTDFHRGQGLRLTLSAQQPIEFAVADILPPQDR